MTIHGSHPFLQPEEERSPVRRLRGRHGGAVSLWTAGGEAGGRAGLPVTSWMVAEGEPGRLIACLDPDSDLAHGLIASGRGVFHLLSWQHRGLADAFAGLTPAPGGPWRLAAWADTSHGPRLASATSWASVAVESVVEAGWSLLITCTIDEIAVGGDDDPLAHRRGRYVRVAGAGGQ